MEKKEFKIGLGTAVMLFLLILIIIVAFTVYMIKVNKDEEIESKEPMASTNLEQTEGVSVVPTMQDKITADSSWCCTFQLVWNDMKNEIVGQDVVFTPQEEMAENLNKEEFTEDMISDEYYYKKYGIMTLSLKEEIENAINEKFNQESDILDDLNWNEAETENETSSITNYLFYTMLYRKFEVLYKSDKLENGDFGEYKNVEYFGINSSTDDEVGDQIDVLYYNSQDDFAVVLNTKTDDEVIFCENPEGETFKQIYDNMNQKASNYTGDTNFYDMDEFKAPRLDFDIKREYTELEGKLFKTIDGEAQIGKALQTIKLSLDENGGEIKSEAAIVLKESLAAEPAAEEEPRYFYVDDTFVIFLKEKGKDAPYFAARVDDITKFQ